MNPLTGMAIGKLISSLETLHEDNKKIISLLENIAEKEKLVVKIYDFPSPFSKK